MVSIKKYVFDFVSTRIKISSLTIRRRLDSTAFCSVTIPDSDQFADLIAANPDGAMVLSAVDGLGTETIVGTYILDQILVTKSPSNVTTVLNGINTFETDLATSISPITIDNPITVTTDSNGLIRFSAEEQALIVVNDTIILEGQSTTVQEITLFVASNNSRMDVGII